jgi:hypothetical protein
MRVPYDRRVELTPEWALVWADVRIKVVRHGTDQSVIEVSAPPASFTPQAFQSRVDSLLGRTRAMLLRYRSTTERLGLPQSDDDREP